MYGIAILGFGVVGSGVAEVLDKNADRITLGASRELTLKHIVDIRDFPDSPYKNLLTRDFETVVNDPEVRVVVETIGGVGLAYEYTRRALDAGKSVVTSNKELVARRGVELLSLAEERGVNYLFEASVGGGIPILRPITQCLAANKIFEIYGILNGTTNYILTSMIKDGAGLEDALKLAQSKGYAEADPSSDIDGTDACRKICILADLCFGRHMDPDWLKTVGIRAVTAADTAYADRGGYKIKLLGRAVANPDGRISAYVAPHLVSSDNLLAGVEGVMNAIVVRGNAIGDVMFYGAGAGKLPTASAVVADIIDAAKHEHSRRLIAWKPGDPTMLRDSAELAGRWYARVAENENAVRGVFPSVEILGKAEGETAFITPADKGAEGASKAEIDAALADFNVLSLFRVIA
ncbi:MAG: homoserine dehydrogenase [Oscillospiraceae bacterium]|jgi:homoserine dehydrogenase|nr:homoserine dehydrogenase [Oscillospiraceae bacterium]